MKKEEEEKLKYFFDKIIKISDDYKYEEEILMRPFELNSWWNYIQAKKDEDINAINLIYERALNKIPGSYKLWHSYLETRIQQVEKKCIDEWEEVNEVFERSLVTMHKMPLIWIEYIKFLIKQRKITKTRMIINRSLQEIPITQHSKIWKVVLNFIYIDYVPIQTSKLLFKR
jgi:pre-mRNA-splicing factor SYF1